MKKEYAILRDPSEHELNRYAKNGWRVISCVPETTTRYQGYLETIIVVFLEKECE